MFTWRRLDDGQSVRADVLTWLTVTKCRFNGCNVGTFLSELKWFCFSSDVQPTIALSDIQHTHCMNPIHGERGSSFSSKVLHTLQSAIILTCSVVKMLSLVLYIYTFLLIYYYVLLEHHRGMNVFESMRVTNTLNRTWCYTTNPFLTSLALEWLQGWQASSLLVM